MNMNDSKNFVHITTDLTIEGQNNQEVHATFLEGGLFTRDDVFQSGGVTYRGSWVADGGDLAAPANTRERRLLCNLGRAAITFTGTAISLRTSMNPGWGTANVLIDGVKPSAIAGLTTAKDIVSCEADSVGSWGNEYIDQLIADNLPPGTHTMELLCTSNSATEFFVFSGAKVYDFGKKTASAQKWVVSTLEREQPIGLTFKLIGTNRVRNATATFDPIVVGADKQPIGTIPLTGLAPLVPFNVTALPQFSGNETSGALSLPISLHYQVQDPLGNVGVTDEVRYDQADPKFIYTGAWWVDPASVDGYPVQVRAAGTRASWFTFEMKGDAFRILCWTDYGLSPGVVFKNVVQRTQIAIVSASNKITVANLTGIAVGSHVIHTRFAKGVTVTAIDGNVLTLSAKATGATANAVVAFGNYVGDIVTTETDELKQRTMQEKLISGLGANFNGTILIQCGGAAGFIWNSISLQTTLMYSDVSDSIAIDFVMKQVPPAPITDVNLVDGRVAYTNPDHAASSMLGEKPFDNRAVDSIDVEYRFPTFICCYTPGYLELFKQYDIVITDPGAYTHAECQELRALGIRVYMYVSFGEEDGQLKNRWDATSGQGPWRGNGLGPGGYASYYTKGGYGYGEFAECANDRQRLENIKGCSKSNPNYIQGVGRCSKACSKDWRTGYSEWREGNPCGGGFTSANNWKRDASNACSNSSCPSYTPMHGPCTQYEQAKNVWGQDFSIMDQSAPDENGIWSSYYIDAVKRGPGSWYERLQQYYLPLVFAQPTYHEETVPVGSHALTDGTFVLGCEIVGAPIDEGFPLGVFDAATGYQYKVNLEFSYDKMQGTFILAPPSGEPDVGFVTPTAGQLIRITYTKRALDCDGVFMDTVDTVDVYPEEIYQQGFADLINDLKLEWPNKGFCSNRGFSIYDRMIHSCDLVMTESVFSDYNFNTGTYQEVGPDSAIWNAEVARMIQELRRNHTFDVVCLNYAPNGPEGDAIRASVEEKCLELGWMPWLSTILLNDPVDNRRYQLTKGYIRSNEWRRIRTKNVE